MYVAYVLEMWDEIVHEKLKQKINRMSQTTITTNFAIECSSHIKQFI